ncbi:MAG: T9SS type A sorting domain-containing protein [Sphingobacteriales bacterium]|nr:MAG: T9SS type A sorting domain-containing protein [Sphingobacteriales bacterium]
MKLKQHVIKPLGLMLLCMISLGLSVTTKAQECMQRIVTDSLRHTFDGTVMCAVEHNNILYVGGRFTNVSKHIGSFACLDKDTPVVLNQAGWPKVNGTVNTAVADGSGGWYIAGSFTLIDNAERLGLAHIDGNGALTSWAPKVNGTVYALAKQGSKLYFGGKFTQVNGANRSNLAAVNIQTATLTGWQPAANDTVLAMVGDGANIYCGGAFTTVNNQSKSRLAKVDTLSGTMASWSAAVNGSVLTLGQLQGNIYVGGAFSQAGAAIRNNGAAFAKSNGLLQSWNPNANNKIRSMVITDTAIFVGGDFYEIGGGFQRMIACLDPNSGLKNPNFSDYNFNYGIYINEIHTLSLAGRKLYAGGLFYWDESFSDRKRNRVLSIDLDNNTVLDWGITGGGITNNHVKFIGHANNKIFVGGDFGSVPAAQRNGIAAIDLTTNKLLDFKLPIQAFGTVNTIKFHNGLIYIGGDFNLNDNGQIRQDLAAFDPLTGNLATWGPRIPSGEVFTMAVHNNSMIVGGTFTAVVPPGGNSSVPAQRLVSLNLATGNVNWQGGLNNTVHAVAVKGDSVYVGGRFFVNGGLSRLAAYNAVTGTVLNWYPKANDHVFDLVIRGDTVFIGGVFTQVTNVNRTRLAMINTVTAAVGGVLGSTNSTVNNLELFDNQLYIGGAFFSVNGQTRKGVARLNLNDLSLSAWNPDINSNAAECILKLSDGKIVLGGFLNRVEQHRILGMITYEDVVTTPQINIEHDPLCEGTSIEFEANANFTVADYEWRLNGNMVGTNANTYTYLPVNGDVLTVQALTGTANCYTDTVAFDTINVSTIPFLTPVINITGNNAPVGGTVTITADVQNAGSNYYIDWRKNNLVVATTTVPEYTYTKTSGTDMVRATVYPDPDGCFNIDYVHSNLLNIETETGINTLQQNKFGIKVFPVPVLDKINIDGVENGDQLLIYNVTGKVVEKITLKKGVNTFSLRGLGKGNYILNIQSKQGDLKAQGPVTLL